MGRRKNSAPENGGSPSAGSAGASVRGRQLRHGNLAHPEYHHLIAGHCDPTATPILFVRGSGREAANILCGGRGFSCVRTQGRLKGPQLRNWLNLIRFQTVRPPRPGSILFMGYKFCLCW